MPALWLEKAVSGQLGHPGCGRCRPVSPSGEAPAGPAPSARTPERCSCIRIK